MTVSYRAAWGNHEEKPSQGLCSICSIYKRSSSQVNVWWSPELVFSPKCHHVNTFRFVISVDQEHRDDEYYCLPKQFPWNVRAFKILVSTTFASSSCNKIKILSYLKFFQEVWFLISPWNVNHRLVCDCCLKKPLNNRISCFCWPPVVWLLTLMQWCRSVLHGVPVYNDISVGCSYRWDFPPQRDVKHCFVA